MRRNLLCASTLLALAFAPAGAQAGEPTLIQRGEYLTRAADCVACHVAPGGKPWAGGREFVLPMGLGVLYSPNITPDPDTGIGRYTDDEWVEMMHNGIGRAGKHLYPAMPYNSYTLMSREDALAIKAYLFTQPAVHAEAPADRMPFPFNQRWLMIGWNLLNNPAHRFEPADDKSDDWNRGAYLVNALGHCAQCHTPRNIMQGLSGKELAGAEQQGWVAYNLTADEEHGIGGWTNDQLVQYLGTGHADGHGPASGPMAEAVENSLKYMTQADLRAMVAYLRDVPARADGPPTVAAPVEMPASNTVVASSGKGASSTTNAHDSNGLGARVFAQACAGCHLPDGTGRQSSWAALGGDHSAGDASGANVIQVLLHGSQLHTDQGLMFMHGFAGAYTNEELAAVSNYAIAQFSGRTGTVTAKDFRPAKELPVETLLAAAAAVVASGVAGVAVFLRRRTRMQRTKSA